MICVLVSKYNRCHTNRANKSGKYKDIAIFKITARSGIFYLVWKKKILSIITKYRQVDADLLQQIERGQIYICENHYEPEDVEITGRFMFCHLYSFQTNVITWIHVSSKNLRG